jgi:hypothetical protein
MLLLLLLLLLPKEVGVVGDASKYSHVSVKHLRNNKLEILIKKWFFRLLQDVFKTNTVSSQHN